jgi:glycosyltransferase involved in cell wall biosynthesis
MTTRSGGRAPLVSILLCVYNGRDYLAETLASVLSQTFRDFELLFIDDGSTDDSASIAEQFEDSRIRILRQPNRGAAVALRTGLQSASGTFIAFIDQDDFWEKDKLAIHVDRMQRDPPVDLTFSWFRYVGPTGHDLGLRSVRRRGTIDFPSLLEDFSIGATSNVVLRRDAVDRAGGIDMRFPRMYDVDLFLRIALQRPHNIEAIPIDLMRYRRHGAQMSRDIGALEQEWEQVIGRMVQLAPLQAAPVVGRARQNIHRYFARLAYEQRYYSQALRSVAKGFSSAPAAFLVDPRNWITAAACLSAVLLPEAVLIRLERLAGLQRSRADS